MGKYIKKFDTHSDYEDFIETEDFIKPNISYCEDNVEVHYNPDPYNGHEYVDLGLPSGTLWATMNVGALSETDYGLYFAWGETQGYADALTKAFSWSDYKYGDGTTFTKYNLTDGKTVLDLEDDAVAANWGGSWKMPTEAQLQELIDNTNKERTTVNNVNGYKFTSKTDSSKYIFIPAAGFAKNGSMNSVDDYSYVLSSSLYISTVKHGRCLFCVSNNVTVSSSDRCIGRSVRGVVSQ